MAFFVLGAMDVALTWYPTDFGNREWEFATVTASFNGMPILLLGLTMVVVAAGLAGRRWWALSGTVVGLGLVIFVLVAAGLWATNVPLAMEAVEGVVLTGLKKALVKTTIQSILYPVVLVVIAFHGLKAFRARDTY
jgi:hypothetical protein